MEAPKVGMAPCKIENSRVETGVSVDGIGLKREGRSNRPISQPQRMRAGANVSPQWGPATFKKQNSRVETGVSVGGIGLEYHPLSRGQQP
jgi:hypothetical protein